MADIELVQIVKRGRDAVAAWREENPNRSMDLNACYMSHARIPMVDLRGADMRSGDFMGAFGQCPRAGHADDALLGETGEFVGVVDHGVRGGWRR